MSACLSASLSISLSISRSHSRMCKFWFPFKQNGWTVIFLHIRNYVHTHVCVSYTSYVCVFVRVCFHFMAFMVSFYMAKKYKTKKKKAKKKQKQKEKHKTKNKCSKTHLTRYVFKRQFHAHNLSVHNIKCLFGWLEQGFANASSTKIAFFFFFFFKGLHH